MKRPLPTKAEAAEILARRKTRPPRRPPAPAGKRLNRLVKDLDARYGQGVGGLKARWREIAGEGLYRATEPVRLITPRSGGGGSSLEIRVAGPVAALIQHQAPTILSRVNLFLGEGAVVRLRIVQGVVRHEGSTAKPSPARKRPPLDAGAEARLAAEVAGAKDEGLRASLLRLGREVIRKDQAS